MTKTLRTDKLFRYMIAILLQACIFASFSDGQQTPPAAQEPIAELPPSDEEAPAGPPIPEESKSPRMQAIVKAFGNPPGAIRLFPDARLWVDKKSRRVIVDGYVAFREGPIEMFACPIGTKEHESLVGLVARSRYVHAALLAINATPGTPVRFNPDFSPPTGDKIGVWILWRDKEGERHRMRAQQWIQKVGTQEELDVEFVFAGSQWWTDPRSGQDLYTADDGDLICVSNFSSAMLDVPIESAAENGALDFIAFTKNIPDRFTPVRVVLSPLEPALNSKSKKQPPSKTETPSKPEIESGSTLPSETTQ